ncbi:hypothetical protein [Paracoccus tegillarcae]|uniref:Uncharacterized protein n=1 Tax=Paracoccus tegillarcae TaxID=1529068 RepID=A0A2K9EI69_9RHOB|nr:hypothetical protein [Paracoccus tegillarcae]AUH34660.1 hypothetical protein CUV01_15865 [Paracoccus tegillarcae]
MKVTKNRVLIVAVRHGRVAVIFLHEGQPTHWALSVKAARSAKEARGFLGAWMGRHEPSVVVLENPRSTKRKGKRATTILTALQQFADTSPAMLALACRMQHHPNVYAEAAAFAAAYPQMAEKLPTERKPWESEPRNIIFVEALALAQNVGFLPLDLPDPRDGI